jgi:hypothetical protein
MNLIHIKLTFEDVSSGKVIVRECTRSMYTYDRMVASLDNIVNVFDGEKQWQWKVIKVEQA